MTAFTLKTGMHPVPIIAGMQFKLEAVDPTTGADVTGVTCSRWSIYGEKDTKLHMTDTIPFYSPTEQGSG